MSCHCFKVLGESAMIILHEKLWPAYNDQSNLILYEK